MTAVVFVCWGNICRSPMAEGWRSHLPRGHKQMGMVIANVARLVRRMNGEVHRRRSGRPAPALSPAPPLAAARPKAHAARQSRTRGQRGRPCASRQTRRRSTSPTDPVPNRRKRPRQDDLRMFYALLGRVVMRDPVALVGQPLPGAIGHRSDGAAAVRPRKLASCSNGRSPTRCLDLVSAFPASL